MPRSTMTEGALAPLDAAEAARVQQVGSRLRGEWMLLVDRFPPTARTAAGLARAIGVNRSVCHRLLSALEERIDTFRFITLLPGVEGLRQIVDRASAVFTSVDRGVFASASAALGVYHELIRSLAGSHTKLCVRIRETRATPTADAALKPGPTAFRTPAMRRRFFEMSSSLVGRVVGVRTSISIIAPVAGSPDEMQYAHARSATSHRATPWALPWVVRSGMSNVLGERGEQIYPHHCALDGTELTDESALPVITEFSGSPLPIVTSRSGVGDATRLFQVLDPRGPQQNEPMRHLPDVVLAYRLKTLGRRSALLTPPVYSEVVSVGDPIERMVFDTYLHRSMAEGAMPSMALFAGHRTVNCDITDRWFDRIEGDPLLTVLGAGTANAHTSAYSRHAELTNHVFRELGWNPAEFIGYRCDEEFPLWGTEYVMSFDYRR